MARRFRILEDGVVRMKKNRMIIDIAMAVLLPMLMAYSLIGEIFHEIAGTLMLILFITHNWLNRGFWKGLFKGKYNAQRVFRTVVNVLLLIFMIMQPLSGIAMSKHIYTFLPSLRISATARQIHLVFAYWGFCMMSLHAGTHLDMMMSKLKKNTDRAATILLTILGVISVYGGYAFIKRQFSDYMFMKIPFVFFDFSELRLFFFMDYIAVMILFATIGYLVSKCLNHLKK